MYPHHNRIKQRIANGELVGYQFVDDYPRIGEALVLMFRTNPILRPIRPHRWSEYVDVLAEWNEKRKDGESVETGLDMCSVCGGGRA